MKKIFSAALLSLISSMFLAAPAAFAQQLASSQGLTISPFLLERKMEKGQSTSEIIDITNTSSRTLPVIITVNDFQPVGDNGQQVFLDPGKGDPHYSLSSWIHITSSPKPILDPGEKTSLNFTIAPPMDADDGGHYGAILFSFQSTPPEGSAVAIQQKLGAIILVKLGKANESGQIANFGPEHGFYEHPPVNFTTVFKNTGNVHVQPRGNISITNMFGKEVASVLVNENASNVLPDTERKFTSQWNSGFGFGRYTAKVQLVYGDSGQVETSTTSFWVIPWKGTLAAAIVLFIALVILIFGVRKYNQWLLTRAFAIEPQRKPRKRTTPKK